MSSAMIDERVMCLDCYTVIEVITMASLTVDVAIIVYVNEFKTIYLW